MTYALAWSLQQAVYATLTGDADVAAHLGTRIYDGVPETQDAAAAGLYAVIGDETVTDWATATDRGAEHIVTVSVNAPAAGFSAAKQAAGAISDALLGTPLSPARGHVVCVGFLDARTARAENGALRRILMRFRILVEDTV